MKNSPLEIPIKKQHIYAIDKISLLKGRKPKGYTIDRALRWRAISNPIEIAQLRNQTRLVEGADFDHFFLSLISLLLTYSFPQYSSLSFLSLNHTYTFRPLVSGNCHV